MNIAVIGGGIAGLSFALHLKQRGLSCTVFEAAPEVRELGVGITLLPHAMREFTALGLQDRIRAVAIENRESRFFNRWGQYIYAEPRGKFGGSPYPEFGIHRGKLHRLLYEAAVERCGAAAVLTNRQCLKVEQDDEDPQDEQDHADSCDVEPAHVGVDRPREDRTESDEQEADDDTHVPLVASGLGTKPNYGFCARSVNLPGTREGSRRHELVDGYSSSCRTTSPAPAIAVTT